MRKRSNKPIMKKAFEHNDEYYYNIIRENIRKYRKIKKLTQQDLADMTELSREYICDIENKNRNKHPSITKEFHKNIQIATNTLTQSKKVAEEF